MIPMTPIINDSTATLPVRALVLDHDGCIDSKKSREDEKNGIVYPGGFKNSRDQFNMDILPNLKYILNKQVLKSVASIIEALSENDNLTNINIPVLLTCGSTRQSIEQDQHNASNCGISAFYAIDYIKEYLKEHLVEMVLNELEETHPEIFACLHLKGCFIEANVEVNNYLIADTINDETPGTQWLAFTTNQFTKNQNPQVSSLSDDKICQIISATYKALEVFPCSQIDLQYFDDNPSALSLTQQVFQDHSETLPSNAVLTLYEHNLINNKARMLDFEVSGCAEDSINTVEFKDTMQKVYIDHFNHMVDKIANEILSFKEAPQVINEAIEVEKLANNEVHDGSDSESFGSSSCSSSSSLRFFNPSDECSTFSGSGQMSKSRSASSSDGSSYSQNFRL